MSLLILNHLVVSGQFLFRSALCVSLLEKNWSCVEHIPHAHAHALRNAKNTMPGNFCVHDLWSKLGIIYVRHSCRDLSESVKI